ncbi:hypothetical protein D3C75_1241370 [compost metagenome]
MSIAMRLIDSTSSARFGSSRLMKSSKRQLNAMTDSVFTSLVVMLSASAWAISARASAM